MIRRTDPEWAPLDHREKHRQEAGPDQRLPAFPSRFDYDDNDALGD